MRQLKFFTLVLVVLAALALSSAVMMASAPVCKPGDTGYNPSADLSGSLIGPGFHSGSITNKSTVCAYEVGIASYRKYDISDSVIATQELFDFKLAVVQPGQTLGPDVLKVKLPECATQVDLFWGPLIPSFANGDRYSSPVNRLLAARHINDKGVCKQGGGRGCTLGYWKNHLNAWGPTGYNPHHTVAFMFKNASLYPSLANQTLLQGLNFTGGPTLTHKAALLIKQAIPAVLSANHPGVDDYPLSAATVIMQVNAALASGNAQTMQTLQAQLDQFNNLGCPLNGRR